MEAAQKFTRLISAAALACLTLALSPGVVVGTRARHWGGRCVPAVNNLHGIELPSWDCFRRKETDDPAKFRLPDGDIIRIREESRAVPADQVEIVLETPLNVTWWKEIKVAGYVEHRRVTLNSVAAQDDDHGPKAMRVRLNAVAARAPAHARLPQGQSLRRAHADVLPPALRADEDRPPLAARRRAARRQTNHLQRGQRLALAPRRPKGEL